MTSKPLQAAVIGLHMLTFPTRKHSSRMHTACFSDFGRGGFHYRDTHGQRSVPPAAWTETPWKEHGTRDRNLLLEGTWDQAARQEVVSYTSPRGQTNICENIALPKTSYAGGMMFRTSYHDVKFSMAALRTLMSLMSRMTLDPNCRVPRTRG